MTDTVRHENGERRNRAAAKRDPEAAHPDEAFSRHNQQTTLRDQDEDRVEAAGRRARLLDQAADEADRQATQRDREADQRDQLADERDLRAVTAEPKEKERRPTTWWTPPGPSAAKLPDCGISRSRSERLAQRHRSQRARLAPCAASRKPGGLLPISGTRRSDLVQRPPRSCPKRETGVLLALVGAGLVSPKIPAMAESEALERLNAFPGGHATVKEQDIHFYSEGIKLVGTLYAPEDVEAKKLPHIIVCSGYQGFNDFYPRLFSRYLTESGYLCLGFDYRGFAESGGPRGRVILPEQVDDIKNAITFSQTLPQVDKERIGLLGWGMGAANVIELAETDKRVKAVAAVNGFYDGERWLESTHTPDSWNELLKAVEEDRMRRVTTGKSKRVEPFHHYSLDPDTEDYVQAELDPLIEASGRQIDLQLTESILAAKPEDAAAAISPRPLFVGHGKDNRLHPPQAAEQLYAKAREPKTLYWIDGKHNDFMYDGHPALGDLAARLTDFFRVL